MCVVLFEWSHRSDSNRQPTDYKSVALPIELRRRYSSILYHLFWLCKELSEGNFRSGRTMSNYFNWNT